MNVIYTSYFDNVDNLPANLCPISIAGLKPDNCNCAQYKRLAPKLSWWKVWEETRDNEYYAKQYNNTVLEVLNPRGVVDDLYKLSGDRIPCLMCYERPGEFCHRHLVAEWLEKHLNIKVKEYEAEVF